MTRDEIALKILLVECNNTWKWANHTKQEMIDFSYEMADKFLAGETLRYETQTQIA